MSDFAKWNRQALNSHLELLGNLTDDEFNYTRLPVFPSSIGAHLRHDLDHYLNFLKGIREDRIDYESRIRDPQLERNRHHAMEVIRGIIHDLNALTFDMWHPLQVRVEEDDAIEVTQSTVRRELDFLLSHTIHHQAIISMMVRDLGKTPVPSYGVAPSTLRHIQQTSCAQ